MNTETNRLDLAGKVDEVHGVQRRIAKLQVQVSELKEWCDRNDGLIQGSSPLALSLGAVLGAAHMISAQLGEVLEAEYELSA